MSELQALIKKRGIIKATLTNIKKYTDKFGWDATQAVNVEQLETRIDKLNEAWKEFHDVEFQILLLDDQASEADEFEERFYDIKALLKRLLNTRAPSIGVAANNSQDKSMIENSSDRSLHQTSELRLPRVLIEQFSGDYAKWQSFQDQFETSIHSKENLSNIDKFQYLKSLLRNEAASLIRHMSLTDANYTLAWEKLKKRYSKNKYSVRELIELFLNKPTVSADGFKQLRAICDTSDEVLRGLQALGPDWQSRDPWLIHILMKKLDLETQQAWAKHSNDNEVPTITCLLDFLTERCDALEACTLLRRPTSTRQNTHTRVHAATTNFVNCVMCNSNNHPLFKCFRFKKLNPSERTQFTETNKLCQNCLSSSHDINTCESLYRCFTCANKHHTLLHPSNTQSNNQPPKSKQNQTSSNYFTACVDSTINENSNLSPINKNIKSSINHATSINKTIPLPATSTTQDLKTSPAISNPQNLSNYHSSTINSSSKNTASTGNTINTLLPTVVIHIKDNFGIVHTARGLLDSGSQTTLISDSCVKRIGLHRMRSYVTINGLASQKAGITKGEVRLKIVSRLNPENHVSVRAVILSHLTSKLPNNNLNDSNWHIVKNLNLADPSYNIPGIIDVVLGNDVFFEILLPQKITVADHLFAQSTIFGWVLGGQIINSSTNSSNFHTTASYNGNENDLIQRFWEIEEFNISSKQKSVEDECEEHYRQNTTRDENGRYVVRLPFKVQPAELGSSYSQANRRFLAVERKFTNHPQIQAEYKEFMKEYETLGHMEKIAENSTNQILQSYHLPHHGVIKETSSTTKLRVVFDGSCKSTTGHSLNEILLIGPKIQDDLMTILLRFRTHKIAIAADIEKMYRQIVIHPADRDFQRILWRDSPSQHIQQFRLTTVTYGTSSAPFLACRTLHKLANDYHETYPDAANRLKSDFYVDDMLTGCDDVKTVSTIYQDMTSLLKHGGFKLRKWMSNDPTFIKHLQLSDEISSFLEFEDITMVKTIGLLWNPQDDNFMFRVMIEDTEKLSKRTLLSEASRIFDPLGWLSPSTVLIKILFQQLWLRKLNWDDELPANVKEKWSKMRTSLHHLQNIEIPRFIRTYKHQDMNIQLHWFSDASELAYGAVVYLRVQDNEENIFVNLLAAKTKVAPIKQISIPRLELCAAVLLCRLLKYVQESIKLEVNSIYAWTDSQIVLTWLSDIPRKWNCFLGNRTSYILERITRDKWMYVPSKQNPADSASRGLTPQSLVTNKLWWNGPEWLAQDIKHWPKSLTVHDPTNATDELEVRKKFINSYHVTANLDHTCQQLFTKFSSLNKIHRILSYIFRFSFKTRRLYGELQGSTKICILPPTVDEFILAENCCIKWVQAEAFPDDMQHIIRYGEIKQGSKL